MKSNAAIQLIFLILFAISSCWAAQPKNLKQTKQILPSFSSVAQNRRPIDATVYQNQLDSLFKQLASTRDKRQRITIVKQIRALRRSQFSQIKTDPNSVTKSNKKSPLRTITSERSSAVTVPSYHFAFGSRNNSIEMTIRDSSSTHANKVIVKPTDYPSWIMLRPDEITILAFQPGADTTVTFVAAIQEHAPVHTPQDLVLTVFSGTTQWSRTIDIQVDAPDHYQLLQNYPNPFNPTTTISYILPEDGKVTVKVYDLLGRQVTTLVDAIQTAGINSAILNSTNLSSGVYLYRMQSGKFSDIKKLVVMK